MDSLIQQGIKVDAVITDPPYGTTACKWDSVIPLVEMWNKINELIKPNGAIVLFGSQPFTSALIMSNVKNFKYSQVWKKSKCGSPFTAKYKPLTKHEDILIFEKRGKRTTYNPQMSAGKPYKRRILNNKTNNMGFGPKEIITDNKGTRHPTTVLDFPQQWRRQDQIHPTQKPLELMKYLVKTYSNENDLVLDFAMGSGTTGVACKTLSRKFLGIELDEKYFTLAKRRIETTPEERKVL